MNLTTINSFITRWKTATFHSHQGEYLKATFARDVWAACDNNQALAYRFLHKHITTSAPTKRMLRDMVQVVSVVPDRKVWIAVGWRGANELAGMTAKARAKKTAEILKAAEKADGGRVPKDQRAKILPGTGTKPQPKTKPKPADSADHVLADELRRLIADPALGPLLRANLSAEAAKLVGARSRKTA